MQKIGQAAYSQSQESKSPESGDSAPSGDASTADKKEPVEGQYEEVKK